MGYCSLSVLSQNQSFTRSTFTRTVLCTHTSLVSCVHHVDVFAYIISHYTQNPLSVSYSTILLALLLLLGRRLCRATYILCSSLLSSARSSLSLFCFSLSIQPDPRSRADTTTLHMFIAVVYTIPFHLLNFIIVLPRGPTPSIGIQHRTSRSYPQPDLLVRGFTHSRNPSPSPAS